MTVTRNTFYTFTHSLYYFPINFRLSSYIFANTTLNLCTFNCKYEKTSVPEIKDLCKRHDFVFLQETWMSRAQLRTLTNINNEFVGYGLSSMKDEDQIHTGRPFNGVAILWRKTLNKYCSIITYDCDRIL